MDGTGDPVKYYASVIAPYKAEVECWFVSNRGLAVPRCIFLTLMVVLFPSAKNVSGYFPGLPEPPATLGL